MKTVIIADDHPFTLVGTQVFVAELGYRVVGTHTNGITAANDIMAQQPDVAILDFNMPGCNALEILRQLRVTASPTKAVVLTLHDDSGIYRQVMQHGAKGFVLKEQTQDVLGECLAAVLSGQEWQSTAFKAQMTAAGTDQEGEDLVRQLTSAERKVIRFIAQNFKSKEIAAALFISERTVEHHRTNIIKKLKLPNEANALLRWALLHPDL